MGCLVLNNVYDNGYKILGTKENITKYINDIFKNSDLQDVLLVEDLQDLLEELKDYKNTDILLIDYENGMAPYIISEVFLEDSIVKVGK